MTDFSRTQAPTAQGILPKIQRLAFFIHQTFLIYLFYQVKRWLTKEVTGYMTPAGVFLSCGAPSGYAAQPFILTGFNTAFTYADYDVATLRRMPASQSQIY
jgi:hypothetical protein